MGAVAVRLTISDAVRGYLYQKWMQASDRRVGRLRIAGASAVMIEYNPAVGWQQQGGESKQQTRYKAPGKGLRGPLSRAGGGGAGAPSGNAEHRHGPKATTHGLKSV